MSTRDNAHLTDRERAVLAGLEEMAAIEDPGLARRLRGSTRLGSITHLPPILVRACRGWWWAGPLVMIGMALMVLSLTTMWALGVAGALITAVGLGVAAGTVRRRWSSRSGPTDDQS